jgi:hypothetical protein
VEVPASGNASGYGTPLVSDRWQVELLTRCKGSGLTAGWGRCELDQGESAFVLQGLRAPGLIDLIDLGTREEVVPSAA